MRRYRVAPRRTQDRKHGDHDIRSALDRIEIGRASVYRRKAIAKQRWQLIAKLSSEPLQRVASQAMKVFSHYYTSLEAFLRAKWHIMRPPKTPEISTHVYEVRPRADKRGVDLISDALPFGPLWYRGPNAIRDAIRYATFYSRSHPVVIQVYDEAGNVIETQQHFLKP